MLCYVPRSGRSHGEAASPARAAARDRGYEGLELLLLLVVHLRAVVELALALAQRPLPLLQLNLHGVQLEVEVIHLGNKKTILIKKPSLLHTYYRVITCPYRNRATKFLLYSISCSRNIVILSIQNTNTKYKSLLTLIAAYKKYRLQQR